MSDEKAYCFDCEEEHPINHPHFTAKAASELAAPAGSARPLVVTQDLVNEIIQRARASRWGLDAAKCETTTEHYADEDAHTLAMILVDGWEAKYDLVSLFAAAIEVVNEKAQNAAGEPRGE